MSITTSANFVIQQASRLTHRPQPLITHYTDRGKYTTQVVQGIVPSPFCSPWRHPIWRWKLRKLRADILLLEAEVDPALSKRMREIEDEAFLRGTTEL